MIILARAIIDSRWLTGGQQKWATTRADDEKSCPHVMRSLEPDPWPMPLPLWAWTGATSGATCHTRPPTQRPLWYMAGWDFLGTKIGVWGSTKSWEGKTHNVIGGKDQIIYFHRFAPTPHYLVKKTQKLAFWN